MAEQADNPADKRKFPRSGVIWPGTFETESGTVACTVLNLSANGAKLRLQAPLAAGISSGTLTIARVGAFKAAIAWRAAKGVTEIGLTFEDPPEAVARILAEILPKSRAASIG